MSLAEPFGAPVAVVIAGREFEAQRTAEGDWWLFGVRKAKYRTYRHSDGSMFLVSFTRPGSFRPDPLGPIVLSDAGGTLRVV